MQNKNKPLIFGGIKETDILVFTKHLTVMLKSGITLVDSLEILRNQNLGKISLIINNLFEVVKSGKTFHEALEEYPKYFSSIYVNLVKTGELSGTLEDSLKRLSKELEKNYKLRKRIRAAMIYPAIVFIALTVLSMTIGMFVLPKLVPSFTALDFELPFTTRLLIYVGGKIEQFGIWFFLIPIIAVFALIFIARLSFVRPLTHRVFLALPGVGPIMKNISLERFTRTLGTLLESGIPLNDALKITGESMVNRAYRKAISQLAPEIEAGQTLQAALMKNSEKFSLIIIKMIGVGEKTGNLETNLKYLSNFYESEIQQSTKNLSVILEPVLLIIIGVLVGTVAIAILTPIYQLTGDLRA